LAAVSFWVTKAWKFGQVARDAEQDEVDFAREHVAAAHLRPGTRLFFEGFQVSFRLTGEPDKAKAVTFIAQDRAVEIAW